MDKGEIKSGYAAIVGRPNVGKSTLLNTILEQKLVAVCPKPQTTRNKILGIYNDKQAQIIFIDTPGIHKPCHELGRMMNKAAQNAEEEADVILVLIDAEDGLIDEDIKILKKAKTTAKKILVLINKIDKVAKLDIIPLIDKCQKQCLADEYLPISARDKQDAGRVVDLLKKCLSPGPRYFPEDNLTDKNERFIAAEIIREQVLKLLREEVPHSVAVLVEEFKQRENKPLIYIKAVIYTERAGHKAIIIGKDGTMLKLIGEKSRLELERCFGQKIYLDLWIKIEKNWRNNKDFLKKLGMDIR